MPAMHVLYEEDGGFKAATILSEAEASFQVETPHGKRSKIKASSVVIKFAQPSPAELLVQAERAAADLDLDFLWEVAPPEDFDAHALGAEYFGHAPSPVESTALLLRLHGAPMYFYKRGKGKYKAAPEEALKAALASVEKKKALAAQQAAYADDLRQGRLPDAIRAQALQLLVKPDKNGIEYKALEAACEALQTRPERLLLKLGALPGAYALHTQRFLAEYFPKGTGFPAVEVPAVEHELPLAAVQAFSIDDVTTTEIDDAFSVTALDDGCYRIGIHIAAPGLAVHKGSALDAMARARMSTVYMPGDKITMQPDPLVERFTLSAGKTCPAVSLYLTTRAGEWTVLETESRIEAVPIAANLRHNVLDGVVSEAALAESNADIPFRADLAVLWEVAKRLSAGREAVRGKPELHTRIDYSFYIAGDANNPESAQVSIVPRKRDALLDLLVAEYMIFANSTWGKLMADCGVPGIYRSQQFGRVKMSAHPQPHQSIGVAQYAWCTSPLRRYVDLVNQWQVLACIERGVAAPLAAPFKPKDADLFAIIGAFDALYAAYAEHQSNMERFWCLRWLKQESARRLQAVAVREDTVRLAQLPLYLPLAGLPELPRGTPVLIDILDIDEVDLVVGCRFVQAVEGEVEPEEEPVEESETEAAPAPAATAETAPETPS
jgi:exoribonuclease-2